MTDSRSTAAELDIGPLTWVKGEIDVALAEARDQLAAFLNSGDAKDVRRAASAVHQVSGALSMVGLLPAKRFCEELEQLIEVIAGIGPSAGQPVATARAASNALSAYLDTLLAGEPDLPMVLLANYLEVNRARGKSDGCEGDLFFPPLSAPIALPTRDKSALLDDGVAQKALIHQRAQYQQGLLRVMKGADTAESLRLMLGAVGTVESLRHDPSERAFWNAAVGFLESLAYQGAEINVAAKQLFARIDQQIKLSIDNAWNLNERLFRDLLLFLARARPVTGRVAQIHEVYQLRRLVALPEMPRGINVSESEREVVRELHGLIAVQKDTWLRYTSGQRTALDPFADQAIVLADKARQQPNQDFAILLAVLKEVGPHLKSRQIPPSENQSLEVATALLFCETALENYYRLGADFSRQARIVAQRVRAAMAGERLPMLESDGLLDATTRRAQDRLLVFQVAQEVQANLASIEAALDGYFRDAARQSDLAGLATQFSQVRGALLIMDLQDASELNQALAERVRAMAEAPPGPAPQPEAQRVADGLSALSLYFGALQKGEARPASLLMPAMLALGLREAVAAQPVQVQLPAATESAEVNAALAAVTAVYGDMGLPTVPDLTAGESTLITRPDLPKVELPMLDLDTPGAAATSPAPSANSLPTLRMQTLEADSGVLGTPSIEAAQARPVTFTDRPQSIDDELLNIFLEEAAEVIVTVGEQLEQLSQVAHDREALTVVRRGFHTLKGSGRMVGLNELGEMAWQCEQVMNKWLADDRPATPDLLVFIETAQHQFAGWILSLQEHGEAQIDGSALVLMAERLKSGLLLAAEPLPAAAEVDTATHAPEALPQSGGAPPESTVQAPASTPEPEQRPLADAPALAMDIPSAASAQPLVVPEPPLEPVVASPSEDADLLIGSVSIAPAFLGIYLGEAETHVETLQREMTAVEADPSIGIAHAFMRAAHTLTSTSRTTGFTPISDVAYPLEKWLQDAMEHKPTLDAAQLAGMRAAVDAITQMVAAVVRLEPPSAQPEVIRTLVQMREQYSEARKSATGVHQQLASITQQLRAISAEGELPEPLAPIALDKTVDLKPSSARMAEAKAELHSATLAVSAPLPPAIAASEPVPSIEPEHAVAPELAMPPMSSDTPETEARGPVAAIAAESAPFAPAARLEGPPVGDSDAVIEPVLAAAAPALMASETAASIDQTTAVQDVVTSPDRLTPAPDEPADVAQPADFEPVAAPSGLLDAQGAAHPAAAVAVAVVGDLPPPITPPLALPADEAAIPAIGTAAATPIQVPLPGAPIHAETATAPASEPVQDRPTEGMVLEVGKDRRAIRDDIDADLLPVFVEEARELLPQAGAALRLWREHPDNLAAAGELQRHLHTLKGSARMTGLMRLGELAHVIESKVIGMGTSEAVTQQDFDDVQDKLDRFSVNLERVGTGEDLGAEPIELPVAAELDQIADKPAVLATIAAAQREAAAQTIPERERQALLRVPADAVDRFVNQAGELSIARSRVEGELSTFKRALIDLTENVSRMRGQLREIEIASETQIQSAVREKEERGLGFDPLEMDRFSRMQELTRFMAESVNDLVTLQLSLQRNLDETEAALLQQMRLNRDLQQGLMGVRLVPLTNLADRFYRVVRQTAKELGKRANLELRGVRVELDRSVLEKITAPFEHLLRNSIAHGIEAPSERTRLGKPEIGEIGIDATQVGNEVVLTVSDDGQGLNYGRIREKAIEQGLLAPHGNANDATLAQFIFMPGFSTAREVTQIAGRGVGMDVVKSEISALGGRIEIASVPGKGTTFTITLPLTLAVTQAVLLRAGSTTYAVPSVMVEQVQEYKANGYADILARGEVRFKENIYPLRSLLPLLGELDTPTPSRQIPVLLLRSGAQRAAVRVDEVLGNREIVVKTIGPQLARIPGIAGATVLGSGQVVLILNPVQLLHRTVAITTAAPGPLPAIAKSSGDLVVSQASGLPLVMVVDDSLTVRKITSRMLAREGFEVVTAKDGVDALQQLQDTRPDVILSDIEMPRMDGFELLRNIRADEGLRRIPIIMITSRTADKHRAHAIELGVNEYLGKPYQEDELLALIRQYTEAMAQAVA